MSITPRCEGDTADAVLRALADQRHRLVMRYLQDASDGVASYDELAEYINTHRSGAQDPEHVKIQLHHAILPTLEAANLVEYDSRSDIVRHRPKSITEAILAVVERWDA